MSGTLPIPLSQIIVEFGPSIGKFHNCDIAEWIEAADGSRSMFWGVFNGNSDQAELKKAQIMLDPGIIYERQ